MIAGRRRWLAGLLVTFALLGSGCATTEQKPATATTSSAAQTELPRPLPAKTDESAAPVRVGIGGHTAPVDPVATDTTGTLLPPQDVSRLGWWVDSALPGSGVGTVVIAGHVDEATQGTGFAARFATIPVGSEVTVTSSSGTAVTYRITRIQKADKRSAFPAAELNRLDGAQTLALVTCGGRFVGPPLGYADNVIAWGTPV